ncbi:MAG: choice-of-anchor Q domain-containing protein [Chloroherpetonaceae bacterium]|nr:T9SS type A sorting domain-containing protein [Chloroherpetonaceae bacterium]MDW8020868.1 choice-of-anchor Q domain-containing protein [Chloroherpetonaceae bacterium]
MPEKSAAFSVLANYTLNQTLSDEQAPTNPARNIQHMGGAPTYSLNGILLTGTRYLQSPVISGLGNSRFTITANFRITGYPSDYMPVITAFDSEIAVLVTSSGTLQLRVGTSTVSTTQSVPLSEFHNITVTRGDGTTRLYFNGVLVATSTSAVSSSTNQLLTRSSIGTTLRYFNGIIKNIQVYNLDYSVNTLTDATSPSLGQFRRAVRDIPSGGSIVFEPTLSGTIDLTVGGTLGIGTLLGTPYGALTICQPPSGNITLRMNRNVPTFEIAEFENVPQPFPDGEISNAKKPDAAAKKVGESRLNATGTTSDIVNIAGITIDGNNAGGGGIVFLSESTSRPLTQFGGTFRATNCVFRNCRGANGGAVDIQSTSTAGFNFVNCTFEGNHATSGWGGAISSTPAGILDITNCTFTNNQAALLGGAIGLPSGGTVNITNSTFANNSSQRNGGAIALQASAAACTLSVTGSTFSNNSAATGFSAGGMFVSAASGRNARVVLTNCTFSGNTAGTSPAGINMIGSGTISAELRQCTVTENSPGGIGIGSGAAMVMVNTIVALNSGSDITGSISTTGSVHNLVGNGTGMTGIANGSNGNQVGTATSPINPRLSALGNYGGPTQTRALLPGSPAIDAGASGAPATDQRGVSRVGAPDIGAFESRGFTITATGGTSQSTLVGTAFPTALSASVSSSFGEPVNGGVITFTAPASGASCTFSPNPATISGGAVSTTATANSTWGSYTVTASAAGISGSVSYNLVNIAPEPTASSGVPVLSTTPTAPPNITVSFTPASPAPTGYLVVRRPDGTPRTSPADGTPYTVGSTFSGQTVVSNTNATSFTDNTVTFGVGYFYDVYPFNGAGPAINYFQAGVRTNAVPLVALPVELTSFEAKALAHGVELRWTTASEQNNAGFEVQRRRIRGEVGSEAWQVLGFVRGYGTTSEAKSYSFLDRTASGRVEYRLKQIDFDGTFEYSPVIEVEASVPRTFELLQNYPNPFNPTTVISYELPVATEVRLEVFDMLGRRVATLVNARQEAGRYQVSFNASELTSGLYLYRL